ncbi:MAG: class I SAM-dependent methyltransferase [Thermoleophilaceae bacterium]
MAPDSCVACLSRDSAKLHDAREMMFGLRDSFRYRECAACGALQLLEPPADASRYYPPQYYSLVTDEAPEQQSRVGAVLRRARGEVALRLPADVTARLVDRRRLRYFYRWLAGTGVRTSSSVCDVGSGQGGALLDMRREGFTDLTGIDPYVDRDQEPAPGVRILRREIDKLERRYDLIMFNHSFEHMPDPAGVLRTARRHLTGGGAIMIRIPVADSLAWREYGTDWAALDAPRHLHVHTHESMRALAERTELRIARTFRDSYALQFWGSEQYRRDIPLNDPRSWAVDPQRAVFTQAEIDEFERRSAELNRRGDGDSAGFVLRRARP